LFSYSDAARSGIRGFHSWMVFVMRGFVPCGDDTMFDQVKIGGGEEDFHGCVPVEKWGNPSTNDSRINESCDLNSGIRAPFVDGFVLTDMPRGDV
jgi:hypothetical protein